MFNPRNACVLILCCLIGCAQNRPLPVIEIPDLVDSFSWISPSPPQPELNKWYRPSVAVDEASVVFTYSSRESDPIRLEAAIAQTVADLDKRTVTPAQRTEMQHALGGLYLNIAHLLLSDEPGYDWGPYVEASRAAASSYSAAGELGRATEQPNAAVIQLVQDAHFKVGQIYYSLGMGLRLTDDLEGAIPPLKRLVEYIDNGLTPTSPKTQANLKTALMYIGSGYFELGQIQSALDNEISAEAASVFFTQSAEAFEDLVRRFPETEEASRWLYQVGESYLAANQYAEAAVAYEKVRQRHPAHVVVPESLAKIAFCYEALASSQTRPATSRRWTEKRYETYEMLAARYPASAFTPEAFIRLGDRYYDRGADAAGKTVDRLRGYKLAAEQYRKAAGASSDNARIAETAARRLRDMERMIAGLLYVQASGNLDQAKFSRGKAQRSVMLGVLAEFQQIIDVYPNTTYADLAYIQIGRAYMYLAIQDEKYYQEASDAFAALQRAYTETPADKVGRDALEYAQIQLNWIQARYEF